MCTVQTSVCARVVRTQCAQDNARPSVATLCRHRPGETSPATVLQGKSLSSKHPQISVRLSQCKKLCRGLRAATVSRRRGQTNTGSRHLFAITFAATEKASKRTGLDKVADEDSVESSSAAPSEPAKPRRGRKRSVELKSFKDLVERSAEVLASLGFEEDEATAIISKCKEWQVRTTRSTEKGIPSEPAEIPRPVLNRIYKNAGFELVPTLLTEYDLPREIVAAELQKSPELLTIDLKQDWASYYLALWIEHRRETWGLPPELGLRKSGFEPRRPDATGGKTRGRKTGKRTMEQWVQSQKTSKKRGRLGGHRRMLLELAGVQWELMDQAWEAMFDELVAYRMERASTPHHAAPPPPSRHLTQWLLDQRAHFAAGRMPEAGLRRLQMMMVNIGPPPAPEPANREPTKRDAEGSLAERRQRSKSAASKSAESTGKGRGSGSRERARKGERAGVSSAAGEAGKSAGGAVSKEKVKKGEGAASKEKVREKVREPAWRVAAGVEKDREFEPALQQFQAFVNGNDIPLRRLKQEGEEGEKYHKWLTKQKLLYAECKMPPHRCKMMAEAGLDLEPRQIEWERKLDMLLEYIAEHGHCVVPQSTPVLGTWVNRQRTRKKRFELSETRAARLDALGFVWDPKRTTKWDLGVQRYRAYCQMRTAAAPGTTPSDPEYVKIKDEVEEWLYKARMNCNYGVLSRTRQQELDSVHAKWMTDPEINVDRTQEKPKRKSKR